MIAYLKALIEANDWMRKDPKSAAEKVEAWTRINKEVVYIFLGPGGVDTLDPTIKKPWVDAIAANYAILRKLNMIKELNIGAWINDSYLRETYKELGLEYDRQLASFDTYNLSGTDPVCDAPVDDPKLAGEVWIKDGEIMPFRSPLCTLLGVKKYAAEGKTFNAVYLTDRELGIKVFADAAFYAIGQDDKKTDVVPFLLKKDAETYAAKNGGKLATYAEALSAINLSK